MTCLSNMALRLPHARACLAQSTNKMEATILLRCIFGIILGLYWGLYSGYIGIMENINGNNYLGFAHCAGCWLRTSSGAYTVCRYMCLIEAPRP